MIIEMLVGAKRKGLLPWTELIDIRVKKKRWGQKSWHICTQIDEYIEWFNKKYETGQRKVYAINFYPDMETDIKSKHNWKRKGKGFRKGYYYYVCKNCGLIWTTKKKNPKFPMTECFPERTCSRCNRVFKTKRMLEIHNLKIHKEKL